jgi:hypothetical protein
MPDAELFEAAAAGELQNPAEITRQVRRMLADDRSDALVDGFANQWLYIRDIDNVFPDIWIFPDFDEALREAMIREMELFFESFVHEDRSMLELLTAPDTFVNERLARHYGIEGVRGPEFVRVSLDGLPRSGILSQAGLLTVLSTPLRTSVVRRGKWVLGQLLCAEPPPPPPGVEGLMADEIEAATLRERLEIHRAQPACAACHAAMDPIGFGLENYDGIGGWRELDDGLPVDSTGVLPDGREFSGAVELSGILSEDQRFTQCLVDQLYTYALGRGVIETDRPYLRDIARGFIDANRRFEELAIQIATSEPFRNRRGRAP